MADKYLVTFTPKEPYFFGNEKSFIYPKSKGNGQFGNKYYIKSELSPSQSTLLGAVRYLMIPEKKQDRSAYVKTDLDALIGPASFNPEDPEQEFGKIQKISPIFLREDETADMLIPTPLNHQVKTKGEDGKAVTNKVYTPFETYTAVSDTDSRLYTKDYNAKFGIADGYVSLEKKTVLSADELFSPTVRVGINRSSENDGFFKKEFVTLKEGYSFAVYLTLADGAEPPADKQTVFLGQNKSAFTVRVTAAEDDTEEKIKELLMPGAPAGTQLVYCLSDIFADSSPLGTPLFSVIKTKTYRHFATSGWKVEKGEHLYNLIAAGSVFILDGATPALLPSEYKSTEMAGYNNIIVIKAKE